MPVGVKNRSSKAYEYIRGQLLTGRLQAGSRVSDALVATEMGISRTPVREALIRLENEGLVEQVPRVGIFVRIPKVRELLELHEMRRLLESYAAAKAARRISREQLEELERLCGVLREVAHAERSANGKRPKDEIIREGAVADVSFHLVIMQAAGNRRLMRMVSSMHLMSRLCGHNWSNPHKHTALHQAAHTFLDHYRIYQALVRRDGAGARYWMRRHIRPKHEVADDLRRLHYNLSNAAPGFRDWPESVRESLREVEKFELDGVLAGIDS